MKTSALKTLCNIGAIKFVFPRRRFCSERVTYMVKRLGNDIYRHQWISESGKRVGEAEYRDWAETMLFVRNNAKNWRDWS